jgi:hypothetical protein
MIDFLYYIFAEDRIGFFLRIGDLLDKIDGLDAIKRFPYRLYFIFNLLVVHF